MSERARRAPRLAMPPSVRPSVGEALELTLRAFEVHAVCDAPRLRRQRAEQRAAGGGGLSEAECELVSDACDFAYGGLTIAFLVYLTFLLHSLRRQRKGLM